jgi:hypothetical protein
MTIFKLTVVSIVLSMFVSGCTLSFQNISTHGVASDLVDEEQSVDAKVDPALTIPSTIL